MSDIAMLWGRALADEPEATAGRSLPSATGPVASVEVHADPRAALPDWRDLAAVAGTPYQSPDWVLAWLDTIGRASDTTPLIAVARDAGGRALALLPLGLHRRGGLATAAFLGAKDSNFNMGLFRPGSVWTRPALHDLLRRVAAASREPIDLFAFRNQPHAWEGVANPFTALDGQPSPSFAYKAALPADGEAFLKARMSRDSRKKLRQKMSRLRALGETAMFEARSPDEIGPVLDAFFVQRAARNAAFGLPSEDLPALRRFLDRATGPDGPISFYALRCRDRIVATLGGLRHGARFSGMLTSFAAEPELSRASPGELLLSELIRHFCAEGLSTFDLGVGEARYKQTYCQETEPLFDSLVPVTTRGRLTARAERLRLRAKRAIKQTHWAWALVGRLRRLRARLSGRLADEGAGHQE